MHSSSGTIVYLGAVDADAAALALIIAASSACEGMVTVSIAIGVGADVAVASVGGIGVAGLEQPMTNSARKTNIRANMVSESLQRVGRARLAD